VKNLDETLAEINVIRHQIARTTEFRGYGPVTIAVTGVAAFFSAALQSQWLQRPGDIGAYLGLWIATAAFSLIIISIETITRTRRAHPILARQMIHSAMEQFLPAIVAGLLATIVLARSAPQSLWMLPGLWQIIFSLGVFASCRFLPRPMFAVGVWYLATGLTCLAFGSGAWALSPWTMGVPFGLGQLFVAVALRFGYRRADEEP
jgi:hypothetical protein